MTTDQQQLDLHPVEIVILLFVLITDAIIAAIKCTLLPAGTRKRPANAPNASLTGTTTSLSSKVNPQPLPSTASGKTTVAQKKAAGTTNAVNRSKPSASSPKAKRSGFSTNSTRSTARRTTKTETDPVEQVAIEESFNKFWKSYPSIRKVAKQKCFVS